MAYRTRSIRRLARNSRRNFIITFILIGFLIYATVQWILPTLITGLGIITSIVKPSQKQSLKISESVSLAPPVLNIPYEATNTAEINIGGYSTPNSKVSIYVDGNLIDSITSSPDGSFAIQSIRLNLGTNEIFAKTSNGRGESLPSKSIRIIYDNEEPILEIYEPEDGKTMQGERKIKIRGQTDEEAQIFINDIRAVVNLDGSFSLDYSLNDGENILTIKAFDKALNSKDLERRVTFKP